MTDNNRDHDRQSHGVVFFIDQEQHRSPTSELTVRTLLTDYAKEDPATTTLVEKQGKDLIKHPDLDEVLVIKDGEHFVVYHQTPTTVS